MTLFHELTHALNGIKGTTQKFEAPDFAEVMKHGIGDIPSPTLMEEWAAVGLGPFAKDKITENAYREERRRLAGQVGEVKGDGGPAMVPRERYTSYDND